MIPNSHSLSLSAPARWIIDLFSFFPPALLIFTISMMPVVELRGAILLWSAQEGLGFTLIGLPYPGAWHIVYILAVAGNILPIPFLLAFFPRVEKWLRRWKIFDRFFTSLFARTRRKTSASVEKRGDLALLLFVALPLPITGAWTGSLVAYLFGLDLHRSFFFIVIGVLIAGVIMMILVLISFWIALAVILVLTILLAALGR